MRSSRLRLREKIAATHLLVAAASSVALLVSVLVLSPWLFATSPGSRVQIVPALAVLAVTVSAGVAAAIVVSRWLYSGVAAPVRRASSLARRLASGQYAVDVPSGAEDESQLSLSDRDELGRLIASLDELATSLEAAERRRMEAFGEITHELRTPVAILEGYFEGLLDGHVKPSDEVWAMLYDVASRLHRLVDELQALSKAEARQEPPDLQSIDPGAIAQTVLDRLRLHFDEKGLEVVSDIQQGLPLVLADPDHTIQVLVNLLTNALMYTPAPGRVTLSVSRLVGDANTTCDTADSAGSSEVVFRVSDTGVGIAAEHVPHLFERFFRVDKSGSRAIGGSGIGLPLAKALVEAMGGRIWAESPGLGKGSCFSFTLIVSTGSRPAQPLN